MGHSDGMSETASVYVDEPSLPAWSDVFRRAEHGETVAVIAHGERVADVVPSDELERMRETIEVLSDADLMREVAAGLIDLRAGHIVSADDVAADLRDRSSRE